MTEYVPDQDAAEDSGEAAEPLAPQSPLVSLRARLGTINTLSQREVDQLISRLRNKRQTGC